MIVIDETSGQEGAIRRAIVDAFGRDDEAVLVQELRTDGDLTISLVAVEADEIIGHVALSQLKSPRRALALAPVSVRKNKQGRGIGSELVRRGIERARELGQDIIFVLGDPKYYGRFGFTAEAATIFPCRYAGPYFLALRLTENEVAIQSVVYANAFDNLE